MPDNIVLLRGKVRRSSNRHSCCEVCLIMFVALSWLIKLNRRNVLWRVYKVLHLDETSHYLTHLTKTENIRTSYSLSHQYIKYMYFLLLCFFFKHLRKLCRNWFVCTILMYLKLMIIWNKNPPIFMDSSSSSCVTFQTFYFFHKTSGALKYPTQYVNITHCLKKLVFKKFVQLKCNIIIYTSIYICKMKKGLKIVYFL